jgi:hypothetical protein
MSNFIKKIELNSESMPDKSYYDITITNLGSTTSTPPLCNFQETRNSPFVYNPSLYWCSVLRFTIDTQSLPQFVCEIQRGQPNVNLSVYEIILSYSYNGTVYNGISYLNWIPQDKSAPIPIPPSSTLTGLQDLSSAYYFSYSYQYFINLLNNSFIEAYINLNNLVTGAGGVLPSAYQPTITFDTNSNVAIITADIAGYLSQSVNPIKIYFNPSLYQLFSSFNAFFHGYNQPYNKSFEIVVDSFNGVNNAPFPSDSTLYTGCEVYQEYSTVVNQCPITAIVFTTSMLPIISEQISKPLIYIDGAILQNNGNNSNIANIMTDFVANDAQYKPSITYAPSAEYRRIQMVGNSPVNSLDIQVWWRSRFGSLQPFFLASGSTCTIKILFEKKKYIMDKTSNY